MTGPTLFTARLVLAPYRATDLNDAAQMWADPAVTTYIGGRPFSREEVWHRVLRYMGHWSVAGYGSWTVRDRATGRYLGELGLMDSRRDTQPSFEGSPEIGFAFTPHAQGRGYAREALAAAIAWADNQGLQQTVAIVAPAHHRSVNLLERMGYRHLGEISYRGVPTLLLERQAVPGRPPIMPLDILSAGSP